MRGGGWVGWAHRGLLGIEGLTSILPVSGAEQLNTSEPMPLRPMTSLRKAYSRLERPGPISRCLSAWGTFSLRCAILAAMSAGSHRFHSPSERALACNPPRNSHELEFGYVNPKGIGIVNVSLGPRLSTPCMHVGQTYEACFRVLIEVLGPHLSHAVHGSSRTWQFHADMLQAEQQVWSSQATVH